MGTLNPESDSKKRKKELTNEAAERLAEIFIMQIEEKKKYEKSNPKRR